MSLDQSKASGDRGGGDGGGGAKPFQRTQQLYSQPGQCALLNANQGKHCLQVLGGRTRVLMVLMNNLASGLKYRA